MAEKLFLKHVRGFMRTKWSRNQAKRSGSRSPEGLVLRELSGIEIFTYLI